MSFAAVTGVNVTAGQTVAENLQAGDNSLQLSVQGSGLSSDANVVSLMYQIDANNFAQAASTTVNGDGTVTFTGLVPGNYSITVYGANNLAATAAVTISEGVSASATAALAAAGEITGTIADSQGNILAGAKLYLTMPANPDFQQYALGQSDGTYVLPYLAPGTYDLTAVADGYQTAVMASLMIAFGTTLNEPIKLASSTTQLSGKILDPSGNPIVNATVQVLDSSGRVIGATAVKPDGSYNITTASGTGLELLASATGYAPAQVNGLTVATGNATVGTTFLQAVADPDPITGLIASFGSDVADLIAAQTNAWYTTVQNELTDVRSALNGRDKYPPPPPTCPQCIAAYNTMIDAFNRQEQEAANLQTIQDLTQQYVRSYGVAWVADFSALVASLLSVYTAELAFLPAAAAVSQFRGLALLPLGVNIANAWLSVKSAYSTLATPGNFSASNGLLGVLDSMMQVLGNSVSTGLSGINAYLDLAVLTNLGNLKNNVGAGGLGPFKAVSGLGTAATLFTGVFSVFEVWRGKNTIAKDQGEQLNSAENELQDFFARFQIQENAYQRAASQL